MKQHFLESQCRMCGDSNWNEVGDCISCRETQTAEDAYWSNLIEDYKEDIEYESND